VIPCYQYIGLGEKEFLAALQHPSHPFAKEIELVASSEEIRI